MNPYIMVRSDALQDPELIKSPATFMTLCAISTFTTRSKAGWCYFKQSTIAKHLGKTRQAISQHLNTLQELGYIEIIEQSYQGRQSNNQYRIFMDGPLKNAVQGELAAVQGELAHAVQGELAPKCSYINTIKEKKALSRDEFLREIDLAYQENAFAEFSHLTESEIKHVADACLDFYGSKGEWPVGEPMYVLRHWIRGGIKNGTIRKTDKSQRALQESKPEIRADNLPAWKRQLLERLGEKVYISWIDKLVLTEKGNIAAPTSYSRDYVRNNYGDAILAVLPDAEIIYRELVHA